MRHKYESALTEEREATLKYKGENGIMNKKFTVLQKEIEDHKEEIKVPHRRTSPPFHTIGTSAFSLLIFGVARGSCLME